MCDGSKVEQGGLVLCTDSFTLEEVQLLIRVLESNFGLLSSCWTMSNRGQVCYRIYIGASSMKLLNSLVLPYILPTLHYKLHI